MKAFLSHTGADKELVRAVAVNLTKAFAVFDEQCFSSGVDFAEQISRHLSESDLFVLFASRASLGALWVEHEIAEARQRIIQRQVAACVVYSLDSGLTIDDYPQWLRRSKIQNMNGARAIARDISHHIELMLQRRQSPIYVNRNDERAELERLMSPFDGSPVPNILWVSGLPGVGRRAILRHSIPSLLNLNKFVFVDIQDGDTLSDLSVKMGAQVEAYNTEGLLTKIIADIRAEEEDKQLSRIQHYIDLSVQRQEAIVLNDSGNGLLDESGFLKEPIRKIIQKNYLNQNHYIFLVSSRRPKLPEDLSALPILSVKPLSTDDMKLLTFQLCRLRGLSPTPEQIAEIAKSSKGYPPAVTFAVNEAKTYGFGVVLSDRFRLIDFIRRFFLAHLRDTKLSQNEQGIVRAVLNLGPMPPEVLSKFLAIDQEEVSRSLISLIDASLIIVDDSGFYKLSDPIEDAAFREFGLLKAEEFASAIEVINAAIRPDTGMDKRLMLARSLSRASAHAGTEIPEAAVMLTGDLVSVIERNYHARRYEDVVKMATHLLETNPNLEQTRVLLIKALAQTERFCEADEQLNLLRTGLPERDYCNLQGFLCRKKGEHFLASEHYERARSLGWTGVSLARELANCYFYLKKFEQAKKEIISVIRKDQANVHAHDLWIRIILNTDTEELVRKALRIFRRVAADTMYYHRLSVVELVYKNVYKALDAARLAFGSESRPPFHVIAQVCYCEMAVGNQSTASELINLLDDRFPSIRSDVRLALRSGLLIRSGNFRKALSLTESISVSNDVRRRLRSEAISGILKHDGIPDSEREKLMSELNQLADIREATDSELVRMIELFQ